MSSRRAEKTPLVGRDAELRKFGVMLAQAAEGVGTVVLISGEAGVGKTRLCAELSLVHRQHGGKALLGRGVPEEASLPYAGLADTLRAARRAEPAVFWYAPEVFAEAAGLGYDTQTRWPSYFAWRLAPLGAAGSRLAAAACYSFSPDMVAAHVPAAWAVAAPGRVLAAREQAVDWMYQALLGDLIGSPSLAEAAQLARDAALAAATAGRPLAAANADLPWPGEPHLILWHAINVLREHRGDGHIAALQAAGLDPCEALVSFAAIGAAPEEVFASRGWSSAEWAAARDRLAARGWVDDAGQATDRGREARDEVEWRTDRLADAPWQALGPDRSARLAELTAPLLGAAFTSGLLPAQSTLGIATVPAPMPRELVGQSQP